MARTGLNGSAPRPLRPKDRSYIPDSDESGTESDVPGEAEGYAHFDTGDIAGRVDRDMESGSEGMRVTLKTMAVRTLSSCSLMEAARMTD